MYPQREHTFISLGHNVCNIMYTWVGSLGTVIGRQYNVHDWEGEEEGEEKGYGEDGNPGMERRWGGLEEEEDGNEKRAEEQ